MSYDEGLTDPFDPTQQDLEPETPALARVIREAMHQMSHALRVAVPAQVINVRGNQLVDIQPLLMARYLSSTLAMPPAVINVPVSCPQGGAYGIKLPIAVGDTGLALFADRSLDNWLSGSGAATDPEDCRAHDVTDAIFLPGLPTISKQTTDATQDLIVRNGSASLHLAQSGTFQIGNGSADLVSAAYNLAAQLQTLSTALSSATVITTNGPAPFAPNVITSLTNAASQFASLAGKIQSLKGSSV